MKALLVADDEMVINNISEVLKSAGYDTIVYKWLLKALDNLEEIAPHLIVISTGDYPRHWKTLAQYASAGFGDYIPQVILYTEENLSEEELKKAQALHVRGCFSSIEVDGLEELREILKKTDDIFAGYLTEEEQSEISLDELVPNAKKYVTAPVKELPSVESEEEETYDYQEEANEEESFESLENKVAEIHEEIQEDHLSSQSEEELIDDEKAMDRLEEINGDELAADRLEQISETAQTEVPTVENIISENDTEEATSSLPGVDELKEMLDQNDFSENEAESEASSEEEQSPQTSETDEEPENTDKDMSLEDKLAAIMSANKADAKERAAALKIETEPSSVSFVFTNPITLAMVSGVAKNYNGLILEFTPDIPSYILNLSPGTKINIASMKINGKIENVFAEVMSNDAKKLALAIKK